MKKKYSVEEILRILGEEKQGNKTIRNICRERNITEQTYYRWRKKRIQGKCGNIQKIF